MKLLLITAVWCPSCLLMRPRYQALLSAHPDWALEEHDFDEEEAILAPRHIGKVLPVAIFEDEQGEILRIVGEKSAKELTRILGGLSR